ncbi:DNA recombination protein RmuC [Holospora curviuscula]|uniref:DNA recombination protein RmuC homolog n=1 Tax=Holospora curviuscula TaxID=1082868 RepID=A0A2S5R980_9PROT|nr:DNA recombination protein RmuC [Holospora curviuscula]PPE03874.1 DNA recombination protein RmuC [Holospora curviuscula]
MILESSIFLGGILLGASVGLGLYIKEYKAKLLCQKDLQITAEALRWCQIQRDETQAQEIQKAEMNASLHRTLETIHHQALSEFQTACITVIKPTVEQWNKVQSQEHQHILNQAAHPLGQALEQVLQYLKGIEQERISTYEQLKSQITHMRQDQKELGTHTQNLITALRSPHVCGSWGELQLRRVLELSGMLAHCDFEEQFVLKQGNTTLRPDVVIHLTEGRFIIIDAKTPILHYLEACNAPDTKSYQAKLQEHTRLVMQHIKKLSEKNYPKHLPGSVDFVLLFLPGDTFLSAALSINPALVEWASERGVVLVSPSLLIALLKTIAHGWRQERLAQQTQQIMDIATQLLQYCHRLELKFDQADRQLRQSCEAFLSASHILKHQVMVKAKDLESCAHVPNAKENQDKKERYAQEPVI